jgi:hypothetical protein
MNRRGLFFLKCAVLGVIAVSVVGLVTMLLWNWLVPTLFKGPVIDFWQALGLLILSKLLFWGFHGKRHAHTHGANPYWKHRFYEKFSNLPPSEREAFKQKMKEKWCRWEQKSSDPNPPASND